MGNLSNVKANEILPEFSDVSFREEIGAGKG